MNLRSAAWVAILIAAGCSEAPSGQGLVMPGEVEALEAQLLQALAAQPGACPRPVLRGHATPGPGDEMALRATVLPEACVALFDNGALPARADLTPCQPVVDFVRESVAHESVCSPWRPGTLPADNLIGVVRVGKVLAAYAEGALARGEPDEAVRLLLDGVRYSQDLTRGGNILVAMVGQAVARALASPLRAAIDASGSPRWHAELDVLLASEPPFQDVLLAESLHTQLYQLMPLVKPAGWTPPGGWGDVKRPTDTDPVPGAHPGLLWVAYLEATRGFMDACPPSAPVGICAARLRTLDMGTPPTPDSPVVAARALIAENPTAEVRDQVVTLLRAVAVPDVAHYALKHDERRQLLLELKARIEVQRKAR